MYEYKARVLRVVDGDTVNMMVDLGFDVHIEINARMKGINAPEMHSKNLEEKAAAVIASGALNLLLHREPLTVKTEKASKNNESDKQGKYGRYLVTVINGTGANVNEEMVKMGHAAVYDGKGPMPRWPWTKS